MSSGVLTIGQSYRTPLLARAFWKPIGRIVCDAKRSVPIFGNVQILIKLSHRASRCGVRNNFVYYDRRRLTHDGVIASWL